MTTRMMTLVGLILVAAFSRLIPHPVNFTAVAAMALFGGTYLSKKQSLLVPMVALFLTDLVLGFHSTMVFVYLAFALIVILGWGLKEQKSAFKLGTFSLVSSCLFFVISNFGVWMMQGFYPPTLQGLMACFVAAIPFFQNQVTGDLVFTAVMFGGFELAKKMLPQLAVAPLK